MTTSRRHATKHVPRVSPYSSAFIDPGFVEIGLLQLSQSVTTTNVTHIQTDTLTDGQTDRQTDRKTDKINDGALYAPRYEAFLPYRQNGLFLIINMYLWDIRIGIEVWVGTYDFVRRPVNRYFPKIPPFQAGRMLNGLPWAGYLIDLLPR